VTIKKLETNDISLIVNAFDQSNWTQKPASLFKAYLEEQERGERIVWVAYYNDQFAGYITLKWTSDYGPFRSQSIPEILDLNVLPQFRNRGIGSDLLQTVKAMAATRSKCVGIGVGLYAGSDGGYGAAQRLYVKQGYIPDMRGITYQYDPVIPGKSYPVDDDLVLWFSKDL
jgi:GNAT superfamily N-acetyltransferase